MYGVTTRAASRLQPFGTVQPQPRTVRCLACDDRVGRCRRLPGIYSCLLFAEGVLKSIHHESVHFPTEQHQLLPGK
jgi:hypothetical protein